MNFFPSWYTSIVCLLDFNQTAIAFSGVVRPCVDYAILVYFHLEVIPLTKSDASMSLFACYCCNINNHKKIVKSCCCWNESACITKRREIEKTNWEFRQTSTEQRNITILRSQVHTIWRSTPRGKNITANNQNEESKTKVTSDFRWWAIWHRH